MKSKLNVKLLRRIQKHILEEPRRLYMGWYIVEGKPKTKYEGDHGHIQTFAECGTMACFAGWASILSGARKKREFSYFDIGMQLLNINNHDDAEKLFYDERWPVQFSVKYREAATAKGRARIAAKRIDHFIKTGE